MTLYIVHTNYLPDNYFGAYSSMKKARQAIQTYFNEADDIEAFVDFGDYTYQFTTKKGETFSMEIMTDMLDYEFVEGLIEEA